MIMIDSGQDSRKPSRGPEPEGFLESAYLAQARRLLGERMPNLAPVDRPARQ